MLTLLLLRHAKAVAQSGGDDAGRALTDQGRADANRLGAFLGDHGLVPDRILVSPATRTLQTLEGLAKGVGRPLDGTRTPALYDAPSSVMRKMISATVGDVAMQMLIGHNPGVMDLAVALAGSGDLQERNAMRSRFPPCGLAVVRFDCAAWTDLEHCVGRLDRFVTPDLLGR